MDSDASTLSEGSQVAHEGVSSSKSSGEGAGLSIEGEGESKDVDETEEDDPPPRVSGQPFFMCL
jgi:hypothetical protein